VECFLPDGVASSRTKPCVSRRWWWLDGVAS